MKNYSSVPGADHAEILEQVGVAVITINADGLIQHVNCSTSRMFGYAEHQMLQQNVKLLMPDAHAAHHDGYLLHHLRTGEKRIIGKGRYVQAKRADGSLFSIHLSVGRHELNGELFFTGIIHDLTLQHADRDNALRFGRIIEESSNEIFVFRADTLKFTLVNRGAQENLGYEPEELLQMTPVEIKTDFTEDAFRTLIAPLLTRDTDRVAFQSRHCRKDGSHYSTDAVLHLTSNNEPLEIVAIIKDCTERNRMLNAVQQSQKMDAIGQLTGGIAHDFNNLLTVITGNLELLDMSISAEPDKELIMEARTAASRGAQLTERLLSFARQSVLSEKRVDLTDAILDLSVLLRRSVGETISLHTVLSPDIWAVKTDPSQLDSALMNLVINARDAMPYGGAVTIEIHNQVLSPSQAELLELPAGNYVELVVSDTGTGIDPHYLPKIFDPFFTTKSKSRGHGLGLSMVYGFARQSGGCLRVASKLGEGSQFSLWLPRDWAPVKEVSTAALLVEQPPNQHCILLVEDEESVRRLTMRRLLHMGHSVIEASNADEALTLFNDHPQISLVFTDMVMPGTLSGWDLSNAILKHSPKMPVIISSGYSEQLTIGTTAQRDTVFLLQKPYSMDELSQILIRAARTQSVLDSNAGAV